jgi:membrane associated rhomboid family serine protease
MTQEPPPVTSDPNHAPTMPVCYRHPKRETYIRCVRCDRPICPDCMNQASVGFQCPECVSAGRRTQRSGRTIFGGTSVGASGYVTKVLIGINVAVMLVAIAVAGGQGLFGGAIGGLFSRGNTLTNAGSVWGIAQWQDSRGVIVAQTSAGIAEGEYYRLLTAMFLHYGLLHLLLNMWALWIIGRELEAQLGPVRFLALYLLSGVGGNVAAYLISPEAQSAGASGAIFGLFAALFVIMRRLNRDTSSIITLLVINLIFSFTVPGISWAGHVGGLVVGAVVGVTLAYPPRNVRNRVLAAAVAGLALVFAAAVIAQTVAITSTYPPFSSVG